MLKPINCKESTCSGNIFKPQSLDEKRFQRPGKVRKEIIQRFYSSFRFLISCLLSAEGEFLVDEAWPGMLRNRKVWSPETKKINQDRCAVEIRIKNNVKALSRGENYET